MLLLISLNVKYENQHETKQSMGKFLMCIFGIVPDNILWYVFVYYRYCKCPSVL